MNTDRKIQDNIFHLALACVQMTGRNNRIDQTPWGGIHVITDGLLKSLCTGGFAWFHFLSPSVEVLPSQLLWPWQRYRARLLHCLTLCGFISRRRGSSALAFPGHCNKLLLYISGICPSWDERTDKVTSMLKYWHSLSWQWKILCARNIVHKTLWKKRRNWEMSVVSCRYVFSDELNRPHETIYPHKVDCITNINQTSPMFCATQQVVLCNWFDSSVPVSILIMKIYSWFILLKKMTFACL